MKQVQIVSGEDAKFSLSLPDADKATGTQVSPIIGGSDTVEVHLRGKSGQANQFLSSSGAAGVTIADASNGVLTCNWPASGTGLLDQGNSLPIEVLVKTTGGPVYSYIFSNGAAVIANPVP